MNFKMYTDIRIMCIHAFVQIPCVHPYARMYSRTSVGGLKARSFSLVTEGGGEEKAVGDGHQKGSTHKAVEG